MLSCDCCGCGVLVISYEPVLNVLSPCVSIPFKVLDTLAIPSSLVPAIDGAANPGIQLHHQQVRVSVVTRCVCREEVWQL